MKLNKLLILAVILFVCSLANSYAQSAKTYAKSGDVAFKDGDFYSAMYFYKRSLAVDSSKLDIVYLYAEACRLSFNFKVAERNYKTVFDKDRGQEQFFPHSLFWLAVVKKDQGRYADAKKIFKQYAGKHKNDNDYYLKRAKFELSACDFALALSKQADTSATVLHLDESVNTPYSDYGPFEIGDSTLYFTSTIVTEPTPAATPANGKKKKEEDVLVQPTSTVKLYKVTHHDSTWTDKKELSSFYNANGVENGNCTFSPDKKKFFFTRSVKSAEGKTYYEIYMCEQKGGKWYQPVRLGDQVNVQGFNNTQPTAALTGKGYILYFASDRPGGAGKFDIWSVTLDASNKLGNAVNLGATINTIDDEVTPFYDQNNQTLFFSSNWHKGLGGFDIFKSQLKGKEWGEPQNLGFPFNTNFNDLYYTVGEGGKQGYFASNRTGSFSPKGENCCNDIYYFEYKKAKRKSDSLKQVVALSKQALKDLPKAAPITLYFDNDAPEPHSEDTVSALDYETTYRDYMDSKKDYDAEFSKGLKGTAQANALRDIDDFFRNNVEKGFESLDKFSNTMAKALGSGKTIRITMRGYCSPLAMDDYNIKLAKRRLATLTNYFSEYDHQSLTKYINGTAENGGRLILVKEAIGEAEAPKTVSDNPNDVKNSVYSKSSALERKIQITKIEITDQEKKRK